MSPTEPEAGTWANIHLGSRTVDCAASVQRMSGMYWCRAVNGLVPGAVAVQSNVGILVLCTLELHTDIYGTVTPIYTPIQNANLPTV